MGDPKFPRHPIQILGVAIMLSVLPMAILYVFGVLQPMAVRLEAEGRWTIWSKILYIHIPIILLFVVAYFGYTLAALPQEGWSWRRAAKSGIGAAIAGAIAGLLVSLAQRGK